MGGGRNGVRCTALGTGGELPVCALHYGSAQERPRNRKRDGAVGWGGCSWAMRVGLFKAGLGPERTPGAARCALSLTAGMGPSLEDKEIELPLLALALLWPPPLAPARLRPKIQAGDKVLYFKYAGDNMETPGGVKYVVLREDDILCKA